LRIARINAAAFVARITYALSYPSHVSSLICKGRKPGGRPVYPAKSPVVLRYTAKLLVKPGQEGTAKPMQRIDVATNF
jgi:hypothetical protein